LIRYHDSEKKYLVGSYQDYNAIFNKNLRFIHKYFLYRDKGELDYHELLHTSIDFRFLIFDFRFRTYEQKNIAFCRRNLPVVAPILRWLGKSYVLRAIAN